MTRQKRIELQGHRGARGLKPENTLPSFEAALDAGVSAIETDVRLSSDGVPILFHDDLLTDRICRVAPHTRGAVDFHEEPLVSSFTRAELRCFVVDRNPAPNRFPTQTHEVTPLADIFAAQEGVPAYMIPTLADLFAFARAYAGSLGKKAGKTQAQQKRAARVRFELEIKRVPFAPEMIGDGYTGLGPGHLERKIVETVRSFKMVRRVSVRSFDHRAVKAVKQLEPSLHAAILIAGTAPISPSALARLAHADVYAPDFHFVDPEIIHLAHTRRLRVIPWTVNETKDWETLLAWNVDGIATDYPNHLADWLRKQHVEIA